MSNPQVFRLLTVLLVLWMPVMASAQEGVSPALPAEPGLFDPGEIEALAAPITALPANARVIAAGNFDGFQDHLVPLGAACERIRAYKLSPEGILDFWRTGCAEEGQLILPAQGTATFVFVVFPSVQAAVLATTQRAEGAFAAALTGTEVVPGAGDPDGQGQATLQLSIPNQTVCYDLAVEGIAPATEAGVYVGAPHEGGPQVLALQAPAGGASSGCLEQVDPALLQQILEYPAGYYLNVYNAEYRLGALRGQLGP